MKKDYVLDHNWGSYDSNKSVNKLMLRNVEDFIKYFDNEMNNSQYIAEIVDKYKFKFKDGTIIEFIPVIVG